MEQDRQKREAEETDFQSPNIPVLCANNCGFFGNPATNNLCSKCYKDSVLSKSSSSSAAADDDESKNWIDKNRDEGGATEVAQKASLFEIGDGSSSFKEPAAAAVVEEKKAVEVEVKKQAGKKAPNRCSFCSKRVGLMGFKCRCGETFCSVHRYSEKHGCEFDYKGKGQDAIAKANPVVKMDKVEKI